MASAAHGPGPSTQRPNGRSARIRDQVHRAALDLVREQGLDALSLPQVAERAGVHPATLYRRWGSVPALLHDVVQAGPARSAPLPDTGTLRGDLDAYALAVAESLSGPLGPLMLRAAAADASLHGSGRTSTVLHERTAQLAAMLDRAAAHGERAPAVDDLIEIVVAPLYFHALFGRPATSDDALRLVDRLLDGNRPRASGRRA